MDARHPPGRGEPQAPPAVPERVRVPLQQAHQPRAHPPLPAARGGRGEGRAQPVQEDRRQDLTRNFRVEPKGLVPRCL